ncbi:hypothetical protein Mapa_013732 [Marchantia paleacea]|nr:hypothetical protein Mapa_013732 [Marchantia paleacea]
MDEVEAKVAEVELAADEGEKAPVTKKEKPKKEKPAKKEKAPQAAGDGKKEVKKETQLGISAKKDDNFSSWYSQVVTHGEMIEYYDVSGCYILRPWSYAMWESIKDFFDAEIKKLGVKNAYFPLFVSEKALIKEKDHVEGFAPEVAWVTRSGNSELEEPIAVRPTSETVMYPIFSKWIRSHRDLPLKLNQWCNVVRWEFKDPTPFIRSREFLWQEGHTAFATKPEADEEVLAILELYRRVYEEVLAVPVIKGVKSELEKFAGGLYTTTVEAFIRNTGRGIQGATSHCLGQNFAKMFEIFFENDNRERKMVWQNSWGLTTRTIGVMVMVHGDDKGLVLPPRVAPVQVVIIHIPSKDIDTNVLIESCKEIAKELRDAGVRVEEDYRDNYKPGWKFSNWEMKGVPLRIEIGPKDVASKQVKVVRRDDGGKDFISVENIGDSVKNLLDVVQKSMLEKATKDRDSCIVQARTWDEFMAALNNKKMVMAPWCDEKEVEEQVKERTKADLSGAAKTLCMPFEQPELPEGTVCFSSGKPAKKWALWGRSY